jgi:hypothetical protein
MACTKTIQDSITWAYTILKQQPLQINNWEPGLTFAQIVLDRVLGPPMKWRFNRGSLSFPITTAGGTDYVQTVSDLGWIEKQWLVDENGDIHQLEGAEELAKTTNSYRPKTLAPVYDDNAGSITFRTDAVPSAANTIFVDYQRKARVLGGFGDSWAPIPDEYGYIYNHLFLALAGNLVNDNRTPFWNQQGVAALLGAQRGLSAQAIAIFLGAWDRAMQTLATSQALTNAGAAGLTK